MNATSIARRIREAREKQNISYAELARYTNMSKSTIQRYETGAIQDIPISKLIEIARALNISEQYLIGLDENNGNNSSREWGEPILNAYASAIRPTQEAACAVLGISHVEPSVQYPPSEPTCDILVYRFPAAAGIPLMAEDDYERLEFPESAVPSGADFGIRIRGDSMQPTIDDETIVFVRRQPDLQSGQIGIFMIDDEAVCKRLHKKGNTVSLKSDNPAYKDIVIQPYQRFYVVGKVLGYR
jgi:SOS-response transcriptional repressor LexA